MTLVTEIKPDHVLVTFEGRVEESFPTEFPEKLVETAITHQCTKILADLRKVEGTLTTMQRFTMGDTGAQKYHSARNKGEVSYCRFSLVANPPLMDPHKFGETVATNRGMPVRIFSSFQEAFDWLQQLPDPPEK
jgi:hypothetical protein